MAAAISNGSAASHSSKSILGAMQSQIDLIIGDLTDVGCTDTDFTNNAVDHILRILRPDSIMD